MTDEMAKREQRLSRVAARPHTLEKHLNADHQVSERATVRPAGSHAARAARRPSGPSRLCVFAYTISRRARLMGPKRDQSLEANESIRCWRARE